MKKRVILIFSCLVLFFLISISSVSGGWTENLYDELRAYIDFNEISSPYIDLHSGMHNIIDTKGIHSTPNGKIGRGWTGDGTNYGNWTNEIFADLSEFTISLWWKSPAGTASDRLMSSAYWLDMYIRDAGNSLLIRCWGGWCIKEEGPGICDDNWHHIVLTCISNGDCLTYQDNTLVANHTRGVFSGSGGNTTQIGAWWSGAQPMESYSFLDEIAVWERALNENEISQLYNDGKAITYAYLDSPKITINNPKNGSTINADFVLLNLTTNRYAVCAYSLFTCSCINYNGWGCGCVSSPLGNMSVTSGTSHLQLITNLSDTISNETQQDWYELHVNCTDLGGKSNESSTSFFILYDSDFDGIPNDLDNCPYASNPGQEDSDVKEAVNGFESIVSASNSGLGPYISYRGSVYSWWEYAGYNQFVEWKTDIVPLNYAGGKITFLWSGALGKNLAPHDLYLNGNKKITFYSGIGSGNKTWLSNDSELFFYDRAGWNEPSGVFYFTVPASDVLLNQQNSLKVIGGVDGGSQDWFMLHNFTDTIIYEKIQEKLAIDHIAEGDRIGDACDNCWYVSNSDQEDSNENCPSTPYLINPQCGDVCEIICEGDVNNDLIVDIFDLAKVGLCYGCQEGQGCWSECSIADLSRNGKVDIFDLATVGLNYGRSC